MGKIKRQELHNEVNNILDKTLQLETRLGLSSDSPSISILENGINIVDSANDSPASVKKIRGRTLVNNVLNGNFENQGNWNSNTIIDTTVSKFGTSSGKIDNSAGTNTKIAYTPDKMYLAGKYVLFGFWAKAISGTPTVAYIMRGYNETNTWSETTNRNQVVDNQWKFYWRKIDLTTSTMIYHNIDLRVITYGTPDDVVNFDGVVVYELSQDEYNYAHTDEEILRLYPFVENMKSLSNIVIKNSGKNLIPPFSEWTIHTNAEIISDYELKLNALTNYETSTITIDCVPNQQYYLSVKTNGEYNTKNSFIRWLDSSGTVITTTYNAIMPVTSPSNAVKAKIELRNDNGETGEFLFSEPILSLGNQILPFEPQNISQIYIPEVGRSNVNNTIYDEIYERDNKLWKLKKFEYRILDGSLNWSFFADYSGYKRVQTPLVLPSINDTSYIGVKYDETILKNNLTTTETDNIYGINTLNLYISDIDSGWVEIWDSTAFSSSGWREMIAAYMNGWKYTGDTAYTTPQWTSVYDAGITTTNRQDASLRNLHAENGKLGYQIQYQLANPIEVEINAQLGINFHDGLNQIEISEGIILGESVTPYYHSTYDNYYISAVDTSSKTYYRPSKFLRIYKNGIDDTGNWVMNQPQAVLNYPTYGFYQCNIPAYKFDTTASYSVDYVALDKYLITPNVDEVEIEYYTSIESAIGRGFQDIADLKNTVDIIEHDYARKEQSGWVSVQLLNGWTTGSIPAMYYKDEFGIVRMTGLISNGTLGVKAFILPKEYRPSNTVSFMLSVTGSGVNGAKATINSSGEVIIASSNTGNAYLDGISFRAK